jgi:adenylate cyclase
MPQEIERRWLVNTTHPVADVDQLVRQGYLAVEPDGAEVRLREKEGAFFITVKSGAGLVRQEFESAITAEVFHALWPATGTRRLEKRRHTLTHAGRTIEVDVFLGGLAPLVLAEVEFPDEEGARAFQPPSWCGREVTTEPGYRNKALAVHGLPV